VTEGPGWLRYATALDTLTPLTVKYDIAQMSTWRLYRGVQNYVYSTEVWSFRLSL